MAEESHPTEVPITRASPQGQSQCAHESAAQIVTVTMTEGADHHRDTCIDLLKDLQEEVIHQSKVDDQGSTASKRGLMLRQQEKETHVTTTSSTMKIDVVRRMKSEGVTLSEETLMVENTVVIEAQIATMMALERQL